MIYRGPLIRSTNAANFSTAGENSFNGLLAAEREAQSATGFLVQLFD